MRGWIDPLHCSVAQVASDTRTASTIALAWLRSFATSWRPTGRYWYSLRLRVTRIAWNRAAEPLGSITSVDP